MSTGGGGKRTNRVNPSGYNYTSPSGGLGNPRRNPSGYNYTAAGALGRPESNWRYTPEGVPMGQLIVGPGDQPPNSNRPSGPSGPSAAERAAAAAAAEAAAAMARAGARAQAQAANLDPQIAALKHALETSFKQGLDQNLTDVGKLVEEQTAMLRTQAGQRAVSFLDAARNTEAATAGQAEESMSNLVRERQDTMASMLEQGAGQTDQLRGLVSAARNWRQNAQEGNRAYFDSIQGINQSITDLNLDTQTALGNVHTQGESERERLWQDFYNRRSETFTQLGNLYQQQADYLDEAKEMKTGSGGGEKKALSGTAFMDAAKEAGMSYVKQGLPDWIKDYKGQEQVKAEVSNTNLAAAPRFERPKRAEGAALRRWAA